MHNNKHRVGGTGPGSGHIRGRGWAAALFGALLVAGCSKGSSSPEIYELGSGSDSGPEEGRQGPSGDVIAELELAAPSLEDFVLRATVPVPPGTLLPGQKHAPLTLLDQDGRPVGGAVEGSQIAGQGLDHFAVVGGPLRHALLIDRQFPLTGQPVEQGIEAALEPVQWREAVRRRELAHMHLAAR